MIPTSNPARAIESRREEIELAIRRVLDSGRLVLGPENEALSFELSEYLDTLHTVLVGNGTDALEIALVAAGVLPGQLVLTVANAGGYATTAIRKVGAQPVYVDIDPTSLQMSFDGPGGFQAVIAAVPEKPAAIVVTHLFGKAAPIQEIVKLASEQGIVVVEDCAQSLGASIGGRKLGTFGYVSTTSFYPTKNLGALGDGGAIFTSNEEIFERAQALRQYGWTSRYKSDLGPGQNSRLDEIQAAILRLRLGDLDDLNERRRAIHRRYAAVESTGISFPHITGEDFVAHLAVSVGPRRSAAQQHLADHSVSTDIHYPIPDHLQVAFGRGSFPDLPVTERLVQEILTLPLFPEMLEEEIQRVEDALATFYPEK